MSPAARAACYADFRRALAPVAEHAGECGVSIGVEALNRYETSVVNTIEQTVELIDGLPPNVGIMIDTYHMNIEEADPYAALAAAGPHIKHVQVSGTNRGAPGADHFDWPRFFAVLRDDRLPGRDLHRVVHGGERDHRHRRGDLASVGPLAGPSRHGRPALSPGDPRLTAAPRANPALVEADPPTPIPLSCQEHRPVSSSLPPLRRMLAGAAATALTALVVVTASASPASAATTTLYASPVRHRHRVLRRPAVLADRRADRGAGAATARCPVTSSCSWPTGCTGSPRRCG